MEPATSWLFDTSDPDVASVMVPTDAGLMLGHVRVMACDAVACSGPLTERVGAYEPGTVLQLRHLRLEKGARVLPVAWPIGEKQPMGL